MDRPRVYVETTIFNRCLEGERDYARESRCLFKRIKCGDLEGYTSTAVIEELSRAAEPKRGEMLKLVSENGITVIEVDERAYRLADLYIEMGVIPARFRLDGVHIAMAAIHGLDCIISLNFHHINKLKTKTATEIIHRMQGYGSPMICTPGEVIDDEKFV